MIKKYTIYGERCSGTNYLQNLIDLNFNVELTWKYGWKHFFGFDEDKYKDSDDTLFICIVRNPVDWINSLYREKHHLPECLKSDIDKFLNNEFYSIHGNKIGNKINHSEIMEDRNIYTQSRYRNIFELRHTKLKYLIEDLPKKVKHCVFIKYEDLVNDFTNVMEILKNKGLDIKTNIEFPINTNNYKNNENVKMHNNDKKKYIQNDKILNNPNLIPKYEKMLNYI